MRSSGRLLDRKEEKGLVAKECSEMTANGNVPLAQERANQTYAISDEYLYRMQIYDISADRVVQYYR